MDPSKKLSSRFIFLICIFFCFHSMNPHAKSTDVPSEFLKVPLPVFKNLLESTIKMLQNVTSTVISHLQFEDCFYHSSTTSSDSCLELLCSSVQLLNWSLSVIHNPQGYAQYYGTGDISSDLTTWLSAALTNQATCMDQGLNDTKTTVVDASTTKNLNQVTQSLNNLLNMVQEGQQIVINNNWNISKGFSPRRYSSPNVTVSQDGTGNFGTIMEAVLAAPNFSQEHYVIFVKRGVYREYVNVDANKWNLVMIGEGMHLTVVSGNRSSADGWGTYLTATFAVHGQGFVAMNMGFENTAGPSRYQAVALRSSADRSAFFRCRITSYQDSLYVHTNRQFYKKCEITGTVDFVFGNGKAVFQSSLIIVRKNDVGGKSVITANGRNSSTDVSGFSFQFCSVLPHKDLAPYVRKIPTYLGRPWGMFSRTIFMQTYISNAVVPEGWLEWNGSYALDTLYYAEYSNEGPGSELCGRVKWPGFHVITKSNKSMAKEFTVAKFIQGNLWLPFTGIPYIGGLVG